jgi:hypothetical protein
MVVHYKLGGMEQCDHSQEAEEKNTKLAQKIFMKL